MQSQPTALTFSLFNKNGTKSAKNIQNQFKNIPNLQTRGTTFDVRHLDQFIQFDHHRQKLLTAQGSQVFLQDQNNGSATATGQEAQGMVSPLAQTATETLMQNQLSPQTVYSNNGFNHASARKRAQTATANFVSPQQQQLLSKRQLKISNIPIVYTNVRPSTSFISISRENNAQTKYIDEQKNGPSALIRREGVPTFKSEGNVKLHYNTEREKFQLLNEAHKEIQQKIHEFQGFKENMIKEDAVEKGIKFPSQRRSEIEEMKNALKTFQEMKSQKIFIKKRNRLIQSGWKGGILGVEMPGDKGSYFYSANILKEEQRKAQKLEKRNEYLKEKAGQNGQIDFYRNERTMRSEGKIVPMYHGWTTKQGSDARFRDTQDALFGEVNNKWNPQRAQKLIIQETKGRPFNPVTGSNHFLLS